MDNDPSGAITLMRARFFTLKMETPQQKAFCVLDCAKTNAFVSAAWSSG